MWKTNNLNGKGLDTDIKNMCNLKRDFVVDTKRSVAQLIYRGKTIVIAKNKTPFKDGVKKSDITSLIGQVSKAVNRFILKNNFQINVIEQVHATTRMNRSKYEEMAEGEEFAYIDVKHCFWRIAFLNGYISEKLYDKVLGREDFKIYRNMALACIVASRSRAYYIKGEFVNEISEYKPHHKTIYNNIRFASYNLMGDIASYTKDNFLGYRTDGIMVTPEAIKTVTDIIEENDLGFSVTKCTKVNNNQFVMGDKGIKKF